MSEIRTMPQNEKYSSGWERVFGKKCGKGKKGKGDAK